MSELKPCPFCGENPISHNQLVACVYFSCGVNPSIKLGSYEESKHEWNQRTETETEKRLTSIATKHAKVNDERYELLEKQKSDIEKMLDQLFKHEKVDAWLACKMNDMLDDVNHQLEKSRIEAEKGDGICN